jgi:hypothetical protein
MDRSKSHLKSVAEQQAVIKNQIERMLKKAGHTAGDSFKPPVLQHNPYSVRIDDAFPLVYFPDPAAGYSE